MKLYVCGAVADILTEFQAKLEKAGHEVVGADEYRSTRPYHPPTGTEAVIIGTDQTSHPASGAIMELCKSRGLPFAIGELRKWSLMVPRMQAAGIPINVVQEEEVMSGAESHVRVVSDEHEKRQKIEEAAVAFAVVLKENGAEQAELHYANDHMRGEVSFISKLVLDF